MKSCRCFLIQIAFVSLCYCTILQSQSTENSLSGIVTDETGGVLPGVLVELEIIDENSISTVTNETGQYRFENVANGPATLTFRLINFSRLIRELNISGDTVSDEFLSLSMTAAVVVTGSRTFRNLADLANPRENLVGIATSASVGAITAAQLQSRPIMRPGEVLEAVPGFITSQHSGEGKANQYYLRGFNLDHGSDFATTLVGIPLNESSGAHAHGYNDMNLLIPELVSGVQYTKGPYFAEQGDFAAAGSANINYVNSLDQPLLNFSIGGHGWKRLLTAVSPSVGNGNLLLAVELSKNNGPWELPDDMEKVNGVLRYSRGNQQNGFALTGMFYSADWNATDQIPKRAVSQGLINRYGNIDSSDGGHSKRYSLAGEYMSSRNNHSTHVTAYGVKAKLNLFQNFTYFLNDPMNGDQIEQEGKRFVSGGKITHRRLERLFDFPSELLLGVQIRNDHVSSVGLYNTVRRLRKDTIRNDHVDQFAAALFGQIDIEWTRYLRTTLGLRFNGYQFDVTAKHPLNSGNGNDSLTNPKIAVVFGPWAGNEIYLNYGQGFHSNDPRTVTTTIDPISGEPTIGSESLVPAGGGELGFRTVFVPGVQTTIALWYLNFNSELIFVGDAGIAEASRQSNRLGLEWTIYAHLLDWLTTSLDLSFSKAEFADTDPAGNYIPGSLNRVLAAEIAVTDIKRLSGSIRMRHFGPRPLIEDNSIASQSTTIINSEIGFDFNQHLNINCAIFNLFNNQVSDIDYFYSSRLHGEPLDGVEDLHFHPSIPRTLRLSLNASF